jgi:ribosomal protein S8
MALARKDLFYEVIVNDQTHELMLLLFRLNVIRRYVKLAPKRYRIYPSWTNNRSSNVRLKCYSRGVNPICLSIKSLKILRVSHGTSELILSTTEGIITHHDALRLNVGGALMCVLIR